MKPIPADQISLYVAIGNRIVDRRKELGLSQREVAERMGVTPPSLANVEAGRQRLLVNTLVDIARILNLSPGELIEGAEFQRLEGLNAEDATLIRQFCGFIRFARVGERSSTPT